MRSIRTPHLHVVSAFRRTWGGGGEDQRGRLETQRLAAAGWKNDDAVATGEDRLHRFALQRTEARKAPYTMQRLFERAVVRAFTVLRRCARCTHRPGAGIPRQARRTCLAAWRRAG